ncbi:amidohydrolase family protein [Sphingomonas sp. LHG3406-1]|uniref:amidohydrolase family protein n=1 Tax=Sphingomonas sp. LHG3406-1 TaxID=2804617 RepID=UPI0026343AB8|nr:amidohydrolase family protein [Sphingomonas sp. LHG3406-1]
MTRSTKVRPSRAAFLAGLALLAAPATAQTIAVTGGTVALGDGSAPIPGGTVVIRDGRVVAAGANIAIPAGARTIDATGKWVTPGIIAGFSRLGLTDVDAVAQANDVSADGPFSAALDMSRAINPKAAPVAINRAEGVTRAIVAPSVGKSIFAGQGALIDTGADEEAVTRARLFQFVELGEQGSDQAGGSRAAAHALLRNALREAQQISGGAAPSGRDQSGRTVDDPRNDPVVANPNESRSYEARRNQDVLLTRYDAVALVPVIRGRQILLVHVERASDLRQVIALKREFPSLRLVIVGADEGWTVARELAAANIPVIASALSDLPSQFETLAATQSNIGRMRAAGVRVAIGTINDDDTRMAFRARWYAGNLVALTKLPGASGLSWGEALRAITSAPAEALGIGDEVGSLAPGRRGDLVIWNSDPLDNMSAAEAVFIDGVQQPLDTRQTKLRDRYRTLERGALPEAYRR